MHVACEGPLGESISDKAISFQCHILVYGDGNEAS